MTYSQAVIGLLVLTVEGFKAETLLLKAAVIVAKVDAVVGPRDIAD